MSDEEINIAIAEHLGWKPDEKNGKGGYYRYWHMGRKTMIHPRPVYHDTGSPCQLTLDQCLLPNYASDLNLIRAAIMTLAPKERTTFAHRAPKVLPSQETYTLEYRFNLMTIGPRELAIMFLRTVGKYKE